MFRVLMLSIAVLMSFAAVGSDGSATWPDRVRAAGGADAWSAITALRSSGTLAISRGGTDFLSI